MTPRAGKGKPVDSKKNSWFHNSREKMWHQKCDCLLLRSENIYWDAGKITVSIVQEKKRENYYQSRFCFTGTGKQLWTAKTYDIWIRECNYHYWYAEKIKMVRIDLKKVSSQKNIFLHVYLGTMTQLFTKINLTSQSL